MTATAIAAAAVWSALFAWSVVVTVYHDHLGLVAERDYWRGQYEKLRAATQKPSASPQEPIRKLYYLDRDLDGATISLGSNPDPNICTTMHLWGTPNVLEAFIICGVWMKKPNRRILYRRRSFH